MKIVTAEEMRAIEQRSEAAGVSTAELMEHAGRSVADEAFRTLGQPHDKRVLVLIGPGNNGGDGLVAARQLHDAGAKVVLYIWSRDLARDSHFDATRQRGIAVIGVDADPDLGNLRIELARSDLVIDALLGTGRARPAVGPLKAILNATNARLNQHCKLLAVDVPTGLNSDTGAVDESCLRADITITLGFPKRGLFAFPGAEYVGRLVVGDIGLPPHLADDIKLEITTAQDVCQMLPPRPLSGHKGTFGKLMVVGGSINYVGAPCLASLAAGRVGAGLVSLACARSLHPIFASKLTETTFLPLLDEGKGFLGRESLDEILQGVRGYDTVLVGPGLGRAATTQNLVFDLTRSLARQDDSSRLSYLIDADGLNALAAHYKWWQTIPAKTIITPHSGEMARLLREDIEAVNADRLAKARNSANTWGVVVVLKGAFTITAAPDGRANINPTANAILATAGTGDVLAGAIAGLLEQGLTPFEAAVAGVYLHASAAEKVAERIGDAGMLASDLLHELPLALAAARRSPGPGYLSF